MDKNNRKILINAVSSKMGGALTYLKNLIDEIQVLNPKEQFVICLTQETANEILPKIKSSKIKIVCPKNIKSGIMRLFWDQFGIRKILKEEKVDVLFSIANYATLFCPVKQLLLIRGYLFTMPYFREKIFSDYSLAKKIIFILKQILTCFSALRADLVMFPTQSAADDFRKMMKISPKKVIVNHYGTYLNRFKNQSSFDKDNSNISRLLYATMYTERKNFSVLFKALSALKKNKILFKLITPADFNDKLARKTATLKNDRRLFKKFNLENDVIFTGKVPYENINKLYKEADIFLWPTLIESFGHPLVEAMAAGLPVIASNIPVNVELAGDAAMYFEPLDDKDLFEKMKKVIQDSKLRQKMSLDSEKRAGLFKWEDHVKRLLTILDSL